MKALECGGAIITGNADDVELSGPLISHSITRSSVSNLNGVYGKRHTDWLKVQQLTPR